MQIVEARLSAVVPCLDDGATVREAVDSIREAEPVEIIVVDDGSRDPHTIELLDHLAAANRIRLIRTSNGGVASALRIGFDASSTRYVFVLGADDLAAEGALADLANALDGAPRYDFAYGHSRHFGDVDFVRRAAPWNPWVLLHSNLWEVSCLFRREAVLAAGGFPSGSGYEDWDLFMALAERESAGLLVDRHVFDYRIQRAGAGTRPSWFAFARTTRRSSIAIPTCSRASVSCGIATRCPAGRACSTGCSWQWLCGCHPCSFAR